jgi:sec-independent protein translocase protein TatA
MGIGVTELLVVLAIVVVLFGTKKLRGMGGDLGSAIQNFRKAMTEGDTAAGPADDAKPNRTIDKESGAGKNEP